MTNGEQREAARQFAIEWKQHGNEKQESQKYWIALLSKVLGVDDAVGYIDFEKTVKINGSTKFIDGYIPETKVLIEQKGSKINLDEAERQSDGEYLTPYEQAFRYNNYLPADEKARWIIVCNFQEIRIYNMNKPTEEPQILSLDNLQSEFRYLDFIVKAEVVEVNKEMELSIQAGKIVGDIYDALRKQYKNPDSEESLKSLNALCVRLVFCMYAEDADLFGDRDMFLNYMSKIPANKWSRELRDLFRMLDTPESEKQGYDPELEAFPYVNGGLFSDEYMEIPAFTDEIVDLVLNKGCKDFNWSEISPTIFGAVFESTLNQETRRSGGMHYTSIENIHKVIDPLFMDDLRSDFEEIKQISTDAIRKKRLYELQDKISNLKFLDPACGSGNFLTESYLSLRRLENNILIELQKSEKKVTDGQISFADIDTDTFNPIKVSIDQFYGIEINDFAVTVAKTALWIAESQMMKRTMEILYANLDFLPLKSYANIVEGNALRMDWEDVVPKAELNYIMGNPPFVANAGRTSANKFHSAGMQDAEQKKDRYNLFGKSGGILDYVACWFMKAAAYMKDTCIFSAFVSTNSICQGQQVTPLWKPLFEMGICINFAYESFKWTSEAGKGATVFVVIVGFSYKEKVEKYLYRGESNKKVSHINGYLIDGEDVFLEKRSKPLCNVASMHRGSQPTDNGNFIFSKSEYETFIEKYPDSTSLFRKYMMGKDFIDRKPRYCLWLQSIAPNIINKYPEIRTRIQNIKEFRLNSTKAATKKKANTPTLFDENQQPNTNFVGLAKISSGNRRYIPIDFMAPDIVVGDKIYIIENATLYEFGIMMSNVHMSWMRATCGYYGPSYQYSNTIVYNNFPWPTPSEEQKSAIEKTAQGILDARALYPDSSLADLYDELTMPPELRKAHQQNDIAVMKAYGFNIKETSEADCVAELMKMYQELTSKERK